jgi:hypothetical protein
MSCIINRVFSTIENFLLIEAKIEDTKIVVNERLIDDISNERNLNDEKIFEKNEELKEITFEDEEQRRNKERQTFEDEEKR